MEHVPGERVRDESRSVTQIGVAVVVSDQGVLVGQRAADVPLAGFHEFPGGKVEPGESAADAALRECREESGVAATVVGRLSIVEHSYAHGPVRIHFFECRPIEGGEIPMAPFRWVPEAELAGCRFPEANDEIVRALLARSCGETPRSPDGTDAVP